jgi:hypothetical protein
MNTKAKSTRNEYKSMLFLKDLGYQCTRSAANLGPWDVVVIRASDVVLVQVKSNQWPGSGDMGTL